MTSAESGAMRLGAWATPLYDDELGRDGGKEEVEWRMWCVYLGLSNKARFSVTKRRKGFLSTRPPITEGFVWSDFVTEQNINDKYIYEYIYKKRFWKTVVVDVNTVLFSAFPAGAFSGKSPNSLRTSCCLCSTICTFVHTFMWISCPSDRLGLFTSSKVRPTCTWIRAISWRTDRKLAPRPSSTCAKSARGSTCLLANTSSCPPPSSPTKTATSACASSPRSRPKHSNQFFYPPPPHRLAC